jgi:hypothetical protein
MTKPKGKLIRIDEAVGQALRKRQTQAESPNQTLRRILGLPGKPTRTGKAKRGGK